MNYEKWLEINKPNKDGRLRPTGISRVPELSTMILVNTDGQIKNAIGIELFHDRSKPRRSRIKWELHLADNEVGFGPSWILVPVVNVTAGPYFSFDVKRHERMYGVRFGVFKF